MVAERSVVLACSHAAILEICVQNHTDTGLSVLASRLALFHSELLGKPRLTLVSDGKPLRRLLLRSKKNSVFTAVSPYGWICPSHPEGELHAILAYGGVRPNHACGGVVGAKSRLRTDVPQIEVRLEPTTR